LLARNPDGNSRLHGNAPGDPVSRPALEIPVLGRRAAVALASPEFLLIAACCRWPPSQSRNAAVGAAAAPVADWNAVVMAARRQRVVGLVYDALPATAVRLPAAPAAELARRAQAISRKNLLLAAETCRLQELLDAAGIPSVALKGVALAQLAYGSLKVKHTRDIDLLIPPERAIAAAPVRQRHRVLCRTTRSGSAVCVRQTRSKPPGRKRRGSSPLKCTWVKGKKEKHGEFPRKTGWRLSTNG
jgi:hypothetical protein